MVVQIDLNKDITIQAEGSVIKGSESVGLGTYMEIERLELIKGDLLDVFLMTYNHPKALDEIERKVNEKL